MGRQKRVKGAMPSQLLVHFKKLIWSSFCINLVPKIMMVQFCYVTLYLGTETVSCLFLLLLMAQHGHGLKIGKIGPSFSSFFECIIQKDILASAP